MKKHTQQLSGPLLPADAVGNSLGVSGRTILYWEERGIITAAIRVGRVVRFDLEAVKLQLAGATRKEQLVDSGDAEPEPAKESREEVTLLKPQDAQNFEPEPPTATP